MTPKAKEILEKTKKTEDKYFEYVKKKGFLTGSTKFNCPTKTSDVDFVILKKHWEKIKNKCYFVYGADYFGEEFECFYFKNEKGAFINVLVVDKKEYHIWNRATKLMFALSKIKPFHKMIRNKSFRVEIFETFKKFYRGDWNK